MKNLKFFLPMAALGLLASCSSDNLKEPGPGNVQAPGDGTSLMLNLKIAMPRTGTRVSYVNGDDAEYKVEDGRLYLFDNLATNTSTYGKCVAVVNLLGDDWSDAGEDPVNVTTKQEFSNLQMPGHISKDGSYLALVILNTKPFRTALPEASENGGTEWEGWYDSVLDSGAEMVSEDYSLFTMTNALGWVGGLPSNENTPPSILVPVTGNNLFYKSDENPGTTVEIYVQRGVAKITLGGDKYQIFDGEEGEDPEISDASEVKDAQGNSTGDKVVLTNWYLDVVNDETYPVQNLGTWSEGLATNWNQFGSQTNTPRFVSTDSDFARVYWAKDHNYTKEEGASQTQFASVGKTDSNGQDDALYCYENTFEVKNMHQNQSTRIVFVGKYSVGGTDFSDFVSYNGLQKVVENVKSTCDESGSGMKLEDIVDDEEELAELAAFFNIATDDEVVNFHKDGEVYYKTIIRHFTNGELGLDDEWELKTDDYVTTTGDDSGDLHLLGRYGVLRNNWYEITINNISGPGTPEEPGTPDTPDDEKAKLLLNVEVNILSWAQRKFSYDL